MENKALKKYNVGIAITCVLAAIGVFVALLYNFAFRTGKIGLYSGMVFFAVAAVLQFVFRKMYLKRIKTFELPDEDKNGLLRSAMRKNDLIYGVIIALFALTLPLTMCMGLADGLDFYEWVYPAICYLIAAAILYCGFIVLKYRWKSGIGDVIETETDKRVYHNIGKAVKSGICLLIIVALNFYLYDTITSNMLESFAKTTFNDYASFAEYIETENPYPADSFYYDEEDIYLKDPNGNVLLDCERKNGLAMGVYYGEWTEGYLPIRVLTYEDYDRYDTARDLLYFAIVAISLGEAAIVVYRYTKQRIKKTKILLEAENSGETPEMIEKPMEKC